MSKRRKFSAEFKRGAVEQASQPGVSYTVFDLYGSFRLNERLRFNLGVYNLFDEAYYQWARIRNVSRGDFYLYGYATDDGIGRYSEPGRNVRASISWQF